MEYFIDFQEGCVLVDDLNDDECEINEIQAYYQEDTNPVMFSRVEVDASAPDGVKEAAGGWLRDKLTAQGYSAEEDFEEKVIDYILEQTGMSEDDKDKIKILPEEDEDDME